MEYNHIKIDQKEQTLSSKDLFYNWFAANIGIMGFVYGAIIVSFHLSFVQSTLAAFIGALTFVIPGWISVIGKNENITTFKLSRAAFGTQGNKIPNLIAWFNMVGWLAVNVITGTLLISSLIKELGTMNDKLSLAVSLTVFFSSIVISGFFSEELLSKIQTILSWVLGILTIVILILFLFQANWVSAFNMPKGHWVTGWIPAVTFIAAGSSISWAMAAADWGAYVKPYESKASVFLCTTLGSAIPLFVLMMGGILLSTISPELATSNDPYGVMYNSIPTWFGIIYFLVAAVGLIPQCLVSFRSARINLDTIGIKVSQGISLAVHASIIGFISFFVLFISGNFLNNFEVFLSCLGIMLAAWVSVFLTDNILYRKEGYNIHLIVDNSTVKLNYNGIISWIISIVLGFSFTDNSFIHGYFARGIFKDNSSLAIFISGITAVSLMLILSLSEKREAYNG